MTLDEMVTYLGLEEEYTLDTLVRLVQRKIVLLTWMGKYIKDKHLDAIDKYLYIYDTIRQEYPEYLV